MKNIFKILIFGSSEMGKFQLLIWYFSFMNLFKKWGITKEQIKESGFVESLINYPYMVGHCNSGQILDYFMDEDIQKLVDEGKINAYQNQAGWNIK